ncbi:response regulator [Sulfurimonas sp. MAG313]|nr:response regulator [Sulfurimonas sp. MAG313]MDF1882005.1 response regulator [Sulfurimonas sp. MAG313]
MNYLFNEDENTILEEEVQEEFWHILSVDDEPSIHQITKLVLSGFSFENKKIKFSTADSAQEAISYLKKHKDVALVLLDIVMERDDSGFDVANFLREDEKNHTTRIIIRTGQPGNFPEHKILEEFDVDGFAEKTELSTEKLHTIIYSALRSYRDISKLTKCKTKLESLLESMSRLSTSESFEQLHYRLKEESQTLVIKTHNISLALRDEKGEISFLFSDKIADSSLYKEIEESSRSKQTILNNVHSISYHKLKDGKTLHLCIEPDEELCNAGKKILASLADAVYLIYLNLVHSKFS